VATHADSSWSATNPTEGCIVGPLGPGPGCLVSTHVRHSLTCQAIQKLDIHPSWAPRLSTQIGHPLSRRRLPEAGALMNQPGARISLGPPSYVAVSGNFPGYPATVAGSLQPSSQPYGLGTTTIDVTVHARSQFWGSRAGRGRARRLRHPGAGHGMGLRINHGALEARNGFTHYPQAREEWRFFPGEPELPSRIILLDGSGAITLDVLAWLAEQNIPVIQLDWRGNVVAAVGTNSLGADPFLLQHQVSAAKDPRRSLAVAVWLVREKLRSNRSTRLRAAPDSRARDAAVARIEGDIARFGEPWAGSKAALLGVEGRCAEAYFTAWHNLPLAWKGTGRRPIPDA